jgi:hypothetical protein
MIEKYNNVHQHQTTIRSELTQDCQQRQQQFDRNNDNFSLHLADVRHDSSPANSYTTES